MRDARRKRLDHISGGAIPDDQLHEELSDLSRRGTSYQFDRLLNWGYVPLRRESDYQFVNRIKRQLAIRLFELEPELPEPEPDMPDLPEPELELELPEQKHKPELPEPEIVFEELPEQKHKPEMPEPEIVFEELPEQNDEDENEGELILRVNLDPEWRRIWFKIKQFHRYYATLPQSDLLNDDIERLDAIKEYEREKTEANKKRIIDLFAKMNIKKYKEIQSNKLKRLKKLFNHIITTPTSELEPYLKVVQEYMNSQNITKLAKVPPKLKDNLYKFSQLRKEIKEQRAAFLLPEDLDMKDLPESIAPQIAIPESVGADPIVDKLLKDKKKVKVIKLSPPKSTGSELTKKLAQAAQSKTKRARSIKLKKAPAS